MLFPDPRIIGHRVKRGEVVRAQWAQANRLPLKDWLRIKQRRRSSLNLQQEVPVLSGNGRPASEERRVDQRPERPKLRGERDHPGQRRRVAAVEPPLLLLLVPLPVLLLLVPLPVLLLL